MRVTTHATLAAALLLSAASAFAFNLGMPPRRSPGHPRATPPR